MKLIHLAVLTAMLCPLAGTVSAVTLPDSSVPAADTIKVIDNATRVLVTKNGNTTVISTMMDDGTGPNRTEYRYTVQIKDRTPARKLTEEMESGIFRGLPFLGQRVASDDDKATSSTAASRRKWKPKRYVTALRNIYWGWNFAYDGKEGLRNCFEVGVAEVIGIEWKPWRKGPDFSVGLGFGMKRFLGSDGMLFGMDADRLMLVSAPSDVKITKARWDVWAFHIPLMAGWNPYRELRLAAGALVNFNTYSKAWNATEADGMRHSVTFKGLQQRLVTVDFTVLAGLREGVGIYAKWSPVPLMQRCYGPYFRTWTLGVSLNF